MKKHRSTITFTAVFLASFIVCISVGGIYIHNQIQLDHYKMEQTAYTHSTKISNVLSKLLYKTQALSALVIQSSGDVEGFERTASIIADSPAIRNVLIAPDGIVTHVYPGTDKEGLLGFDFFSDMAGNREAIAARDTGELVLGGPFELVQGGQALVGRLPVFLEDETGQERFWGLVSVTLNYPEALADADLDILQENNYAYEIWRINPDTGQKQTIASSSYPYNRHSRFVEIPFSILNAEWTFRLSPVREWYQFPSTWILVLIAIFISALVTCLFLHTQRLRHMQQEMTELSNSDFLTGIANRRGIFAILDSMLEQQGRKFILCYMDVDKFKHINDTYGHSLGDKVLLKLTSAFLTRMPSSCKLGRIGGDEFVLIFPDTDDISSVRPYFEELRTYLDNSPISAGSESVRFTFSVGFARYPADGESIDQLLEEADTHMYHAKKQL